MELHIHKTYCERCRYLVNDTDIDKTCMSCINSTGKVNYQFDKRCVACQEKRHCLSVYLIPDLSEIVLEYEKNDIDFIKEKDRDYLLYDSKFTI